MPFTPEDIGHGGDMSDPTTRTTDEPLETLAGRAPQEPPLGALVHRLSEQIPELVRSELRLAQVELAEKGKKAGIGVGLFSAAGLLALFGLGTLITTAILALDLAMPAWLAALIVAVVLFAGAGVAALIGKKEVSAATPPAPERTIASVREDVDTLKGRHA
jgi:uncharacterized membrane protein YqjE